jgi:hypothetical protein
MALIEIALTFTLGGAGMVTATFGVYLAVLAASAFRHRPVAVTGAPRTRVTVLVPAHDESSLVAQTVRSLIDQDYPADLRRIVVIADNCTDDTAAHAAGAGAEVLVRDVPDVRGKGQALRWAMDRLLAMPDAPDAIAVVDADTIADPKFLATMIAAYEAGAPAVQGESLLCEDGTPRTALRVAAFMLINRVRPSGRAALGLPCNLCGNGMLVDADLLRKIPWTAFSATEDIEYSVSLRRAGIGPVFARGAILLSPAAPDAKTAEQQELRWEGGRVHLIRTWVPRMFAEAVRTRNASLFDAAFDLAVPPLGFLGGAGLVGLGASAALVAGGALPSLVLTPWAITLLGVAFYVLGGLRAGGAPASSYSAMVRAPLFLAQKLLRIRRLLSFRPDSWVRTPRAGTDEAAAAAQKTG